MKFKSKFASAMLKARKELGYTQSEVAEAVSISVRWYQKIESGCKLPGTLTAFRIAVFLHIDVQEFSEELGIIKPVISIERRLVTR